MNTTRQTEAIEVITRDQHRRRWSPSEKAALVKRTIRARHERLACGKADQQDIAHPQAVTTLRPIWTK